MKAILNTIEYISGVNITKFSIVSMVIVIYIKILFNVDSYKKWVLTSKNASHSRTILKRPLKV